MPKKLYLKISPHAHETVFLINGEDPHCRSLRLDLGVGKPVTITAELVVRESSPKNHVEFVELTGYLFTKEEYDEYIALKSTARRFMSDADDEHDPLWTASV
jgi:hypothetical protein